jgi:hypothetical protein
LFFVGTASASLALATAPLVSQTIDWPQLAQQKLWLNQGQYRKGLTGRYASEAEASFFISPSGQNDPTAELMATYQIFLQHPDAPWGYTHQPVICAFPTRKDFLESQLKIEFRKVDCPEREAWMRSFTAKKLYLVFSDAFPNNPASMFGHTFLLFSSQPQPDSPLGLLDYAVNFSADLSGSDGNGETNGKSAADDPLYTIKGLFGFYPGRYRIHKFYEMADLYLNSDSRDLWYLQLPFDSQQVRRVADHIWEIFTTTSFPYYFFDQNCSYRLLAALDYGNPDLNLVEEFHYRWPLYYVAPISTYRTVAERARATVQHYSPSARRRLEFIINALSVDDRVTFDSCRRDPKLVQQINNTRVLDALITYYNYEKRVNSSGVLSADRQKQMQALLVRRASLGRARGAPAVQGSPREAQSPASDALPESASQLIATPHTPLESHKNRAVWLGAGSSREAAQTAVVIGARAAYHDMLDPTDGYERWGDLTALDGEIWQYENKTTVQSFKLANVRSIAAITTYDFKMSWQASAGYDESFHYYAQAGGGLAGQSRGHMTMWYTFLSPTLTTNESYSQGKGGTLEAEFGIAHEFSRFAKLKLYYRNYYLVESGQFSSSFENWGLQAAYFYDVQNEIRFSLKNSIAETQASLFWQRNF